MDLIVNGTRINAYEKGRDVTTWSADGKRSFPDITRESLAAKPLKYVLDKKQ